MRRCAVAWAGDTAVTGAGPDRPALEEAVRAEIRRLQCERHAAERLVEYYEWQLIELYRLYPFRDRLGDRLRRARERSGLSRTMLARIAGLHPSTVARAERMGRPSYESLVAICRVLGVPADWTAVDERAAD
jgi:ribosome-binding protein aMBF1 (putative translation factor)